MGLIHGLSFDHVKGDIYGGLTAAVVALPLALAFGVASGAGPVAGLYGAIFVGLFAALFGGTPSQISGPTGPMTVVMAGVITQYSHAPAMAFTVVMMAGLFQILFGILKLGRYINLMPAPVISGFMSGIGCIIIVLQLPPLVGHLTGGGIVATLIALPEIYANPVIDALVVGLVALLVQFFLPTPVARLIPAPLAALLIGSLAVYFVFTTAPVLGQIPTGLPELRLPVFEISELQGMIQSALVLAVLGAIDSLLTSLIADNITRTHHRSDRELIGQGIGNTVAGLFGAIPGAGATMRTVINVRTGGRTPISGALHAIVLATIVLGLGGLAEHIPHAVLAGILIKVGIDIIDWEYLKRIHRAPRAGVIFMLVVLLLTVFVDLITAVTVGVILASLLFVKRMADIQLSSIRQISNGSDSGALSEQESIILDEADGQVMIFELNGPFSFGAARGMTKQLTEVAGYRVLILDLSAVPMLDSSASLALEEVLQHARDNETPALMVGIRPMVKQVLDGIGIFRRLPEKDCFNNRLEALERAKEMLRG
jgi:sulfate permease, SulP family